MDAKFEAVVEDWKRRGVKVSGIHVAELQFSERSGLFGVLALEPRSLYKGPSELTSFGYGVRFHRRKKEARKLAEEFKQKALELFPITA